MLICVIVKMKMKMKSTNARVLHRLSETRCAMETRAFCVANYSAPVIDVMKANTGRRR